MTSVVQLSGGYGNQLFQVSFARSLSIIQGTKVLLDASLYSENSFRQLLPWVGKKSPFFQLSEDVFDSAGPGFCRSCFGLPVFRKNRIVQRRQHAAGEYLCAVKENYEQFSPSFLRIRNGYFSGTWSSYRYWPKSNPEDTIKWIRDSVYASDETELLERLFGISIHIRRGDYVTQTKTRNFHGYCGLEYFQTAIDLLAERGFAKNGIVISSDDIQASRDVHEYAKKYTSKVVILTSDNISYVLKTLNSSETSIGSNSTFSWWSSYLEPKKVRVFPKSWYLSKKIRYVPELLFPDNPILIDTHLKS